MDSLNSETTSYVYDQYGNTTRTSVAKTVTDPVTSQTSSSLTVTDNTFDLFNRTLSTSTATNSTNTETTSTVYDAAGRTLKSDVKGDVTRTLYDSLGRVVQEIGPEDYDATLDGLPTANTYSDSSAGTTYVYASNNTLSSETNRLGKTTHYYYNDRGCKTREEFDIYKFYYRDHGELTQVQVNGVQKVLYGYENATNLLQTVTYANDDVINYYYDSNKNLISEKRNDNNAAYVTYSYNSDNELTEKVNYDTGLRYTYGSNDSVTVTKLSDDSVVQTYAQSSNEDQVDSEDAVVTTINESHFGTSYSSQVTNRSTTFTAGSNSVNYTFTNNNSNNVATEAVSYNNSPAFTTAYSYDSKENITSKAITLADNTTFNVVNTYDSKNRITSTGYGTAEQTYTYDQYGQLIQTVDTANGFTETYSYDQRGNILTKTKVYDDTSFPAETTNFSYGNSAWPDELTSVNGTSLTYDANGNVLTYGNMEFEWTNGRTLSQITVNPEDENGTADVYSYTYDESGIRSSKTVNGVTTYFTTKDGVIQSQTDGTNTMYFQYDNSGNPTGFLYNGAQYFYLTNQMGDVIGITDNAGSLIATYTYGAWGEVLATTPATPGSSSQLAIADANPLRYRGYYLDQETGYYYLQSRYYDSALSRFVNSDLLEISSISKDNLAGQNVFSYCLNAPINNSDYAGTIAINIVIGALLGAVFGALGALLNDACDYILKHCSVNKKMVKWRNVAIGAVSGALSGAVSFSMQKKWVVRVVSGLAGYWNARMTGFSRLGALIYATIIMVMINDGGFGRYLGRFSRKGISFSNRTKKLSRASIKKIANVLSSAITTYIRNNKSLYKRFIKAFISSSMQSWLVTYKISRVRR